MLSVQYGCLKNIFAIVRALSQSQSFSPIECSCGIGSDS